MAKTAKRERSPIPRDKIKKMWEAGRSYEYMAKHTNRYNEGSADPTKSMRAIVSQLLTSEFLKPREGMRGTGTKKVVKSAKKATKAKALAKGKKSVVKAKGKKVASTKQFTPTQPPVVGLVRDEPGQHLELSLSQPKVLMTNHDFLDIFGKFVDEVRSEPVAAVTASDEQLKPPDEIVGAESTATSQPVENAA